MLIAGTLLLDDGVEIRLETGVVRVESQHILSVETGALPRSYDHGGPDCLICPGFIDAHLHLPQFDSIGIDGLTLMDWLEQAVFPAEARWEDADYAEAMTRRVVRQLLNHGTTGLAAFCTVHHSGTQRALNVLQASGVQAIAGQVLMDRNAPTELIRPASQLIDEAAALTAGGRVEVAVTPRFVPTCTPELLAEAGRLAAERGAPIQTHVAENERECALVAELHPDRSYTEVYAEAGLLTDRSILGHGIWLDNAERALLRRAGATVAHCPTSNVFLSSGTMDLAATDEDGVGIALASDVAGGPDRSMVRVARAMIEGSKRLGHRTPTAATCWRQITSGNADVLGWGDCGRLSPGCWADLLIVEPTIPWREAFDPLATLLYAWDDRWLTTTIVAGQRAWP